MFRRRERKSKQTLAASGRHRMQGPGSSDLSTSKDTTIPYHVLCRPENRANGKEVSILKLLDLRSAMDGGAFPISWWAD